jgi:hypothetical protein
MGTCKLCGREAVLVRAHIVPDAFHRDLRGDAPVPPMQISNNPEAHTKRRLGGYYDEELLCSDCEKRTNPWDNYGEQPNLRGVFGHITIDESRPDGMMRINHRAKAPHEEIRHCSAAEMRASRGARSPASAARSAAK